MFDIAKIAKKIKETRIAKNMTQGNLADLMGVSYQAVSNWERGNSMPDISKLEDLCNFLDISVGELLGIENKGTAAVEKVIGNKEDLSFDEIAEVAPIMPPEVLKEKTESAKKKVKSFDLSSLSQIAEYLDGDYLSEIMHEALSAVDESLKSLDGLFNIIEYLPEDSIHEVIEKADENGLDSIAECIEDMDDESIDLFAEKCLKSDRFDLILQVAEFIPDSTLEKIADYCSANDKLSELFEIAEFIPSEVYAKIIGNAKEDDLPTLYGFLDYFDDEAAEIFAEKCLEYDRTGIIIESACELPESALDRIVDRWLSDGKFKELSKIYEYLEQYQLKKIAKILLEKGKADGLSEISDYM